MAQVTLKDVNKFYGAAQALHDVSFDVPDGGFAVFVGPSGCGKSTLLRSIAGLEGISSGSIHIGGKDVTEMAPSDRDVAMVFQSYALYPHMTVRENMDFGMKVNGFTMQTRQERLAEAARILQLEDYMDRRPAHLSGGQRQRVAIGRAIVKQPKVFLFDEPLSNLDAKLRIQMRVELEALHRELGATMIYVTHDQVEAMTMADTIVVLRDGWIEQVGAPMDLYHRPKTEFVAGFIGAPSMNIVDADGSVGQGVARRPGAAKVGIRPEHVELRDGGISAEIRVKEQLGGESYLYTRTDDGTDIVVKTGGEETHVAGDKVSLVLPENRIHQFDEKGAALWADA